MRISARIPDRMTDEEFIAFYAGRPDDERWELVDGSPSRMVLAMVQQRRIAGNIAFRLNNHFEHVPADLYAYIGMALQVPGVAGFRLTPDLSVIDDSVDPKTCWADKFRLVGEVFSVGNTPARIERKRHRYMTHPDNLYVLEIEKAEARMRVWARRKQWLPFNLVRLDDVLDLPEFQLRMTLHEIYTGTAAGRRSVVPR